MSVPLKGSVPTPVQTSSSAQSCAHEPLLNTDAATAVREAADDGYAAYTPANDAYGVPADCSSAGPPAKAQRMSWAAWLLLATAVWRLHSSTGRRTFCTHAHLIMWVLRLGLPHSPPLPLQSRSKALSNAAVQLTVKSSAGAVFASLHDVGAFTKSAWRMQLATVIMLPIAIWQYSRAPAGVANWQLSCLERFLHECRSPSAECHQDACLHTRLYPFLFLNCGHADALISWRKPAQTSTCSLCNARRREGNDAAQAMAAGGVWRAAGGAVGGVRVGSGPHQPGAHAAVPVGHPRAAGRLPLGGAAPNLSW